MYDADESPSIPDPSVPDHPPLGADLYCPDCGYSLRGLTSRRCPECGLALDFIESDTPIVPWERRRELGRMRAYWQTVLLVTFRNRVFCRAICRPVSYPDSQRFRWLCILHVLIPAVLVLPGMLMYDSGLRSEALEHFDTWFVGVVYAAILLGLLVVTGLPSYFFHPKSLSVEQQNRAIALSYYGFAALAWTPLSLVTLCAASATVIRHSEPELPEAALLLLVSSLALVGLIAVILIACRILKTSLAAPLVATVGVVGICVVLIATRPHRALDILFGLFTVLLPAALLLLCWFDLLRLARRILRQPWAAMRVAALVPALWLVVGGLTLVGLPAVVYGVAVVFYSLRAAGPGG